MALWGNNDNIPSVGTVTLNWTPNADGSHTVTGSASPATVFGTVGAAKTGDVIRFGLRDGVDTAKYFGDAQIIGITSARTLTIGSTAGLANAAIAATSYYISELPTYTVTDHQWSNQHDTVPTYAYAISKEAWPGAGQIGIGSTSIAVYWKDLGLTAGGAGQDGTGPGPEQAGGPGGAGVQLPPAFRDPNQTYGLGPGSPSPYHWVAGGGAGGCHAPPNSHANKAGAGGGGVEGSYINPNTGASPIGSDATPYAGGGNGGYGRGDNTSRPGDNGMANTGGGGGGGGTSVPAGTNGGRGGSGVVIIAYPTS